MELIRYYWGSQVAQHLGIGDSTLRKWAIALEKAGYKFERDDHGNRAYKDQDIIALRTLQQHLAARLKLEDAARLVAQKYSEKEAEGESASENERTDIVPRTPARYEPLAAELEKRIEALMDAKLEALMEEIRRIEAERDEAIRRRDELLMQLMRQMQESARQIAAAKEEKKPWWRRLFT